MSEAITGDVPTLSTDVYELLSYSRRRQAVWCLAMADDWELTARQIAAHIAANEEDTVAVELRREEVTKVRTSLVRFHIEKLEEAGVFTVNGDYVRPGVRFFEMVSILWRVERLEYERRSGLV